MVTGADEPRVRGQIIADYFDVSGDLYSVDPRCAAAIDRDALIGIGEIQDSPDQSISRAAVKPHRSVEAHL